MKMTGRTSISMFSRLGSLVNHEAILSMFIKSGSSIKKAKIMVMAEITWA